MLTLLDNPAAIFSYACVLALVDNPIPLHSQKRPLGCGNYTNMDISAETFRPPTLLHHKPRVSTVTINTTTTATTDAFTWEFSMGESAVLRLPLSFEIQRRLGLPGDGNSAQAKDATPDTAKDTRDLTDAVLGRGDSFVISYAEGDKPTVCAPTDQHGHYHNHDNGHSHNYGHANNHDHSRDSQHDDSHDHGNEAPRHSH
jgi:hypothetical protein